MLVAGLEPRFSGVGSNRSVNCTTTTAQVFEPYLKVPLR